MQKLLLSALLISISVIAAWNCYTTVDKWQKASDQNVRTIDSLTNLVNEEIKIGDSLALVRDSVLKERSSALKNRDRWADSIKVLVNSKGIISSGKY